MKEILDNKVFVKLINIFHKIQQICKDNNLIMVSSDKTKRICLVDQKAYTKKCDEFLNDKKSYQAVREWKPSNITKKANNILDKIFNETTIDESNKCRLRTKPETVKPASFFGLIKDHKTPEDPTKTDLLSNFKIRPVASVRGTAVEPLDWLISKILIQAAKFVPSNLKDVYTCLLYTSPSPRDKRQSRMPSSA